MIDVRQREKTDFEKSVIQQSHKIDEYDIQMKMFDNANYGYFVSSFYGDFILHDESKIKTLNHFIKCEDYIYFFIEEIVENKYDDIMWHRKDHTQILHAKTVFKKQDTNYVLIDFISNIKEIDDELSVLKLIRIFGEYSEFLNRHECEKHSYNTILHSLLFQKFSLEKPIFDKYDRQYNEVIEYSAEDRIFISSKDYERITYKINTLS